MKTKMLFHVHDDPHGCLRRITWINWGYHDKAMKGRFGHLFWMNISRSW